MRGGPWHIFHFIGHGGYSEATQEGLILLENETGKVYRLYASSRAFYDALADGLPVDTAVSEARKAINLEVENTLEWGTPVLYMRSPDGILFHLIEQSSRTVSATIRYDENVNTRMKRDVESDQELAQIPPDSVFLFNQSLPDSSEFYGRVRERATLFNRTRNGTSTSIVGPRRVGKTWLMSYLKLVAQKELGSRFLVGYLDATTARCATIVGFSTTALEALGLQRYSF